MKYIIRAAKYFVYIAAFLALLLVLLSLFNVIGGSVDEIFRNGTKSVWQIALLLLALSALYPALSFGRRDAIVPGSYAEIRDGVVRLIEDRGYVLEKEEGENLVFRFRSPVRRLSHMFEDRITFTRSMTGFELEGYLKDIVRVISALEYRFRDE